MMTGGTLRRMGAEYEIVSRDIIAPLFPKRAADTHKGDYGKLAIVGGCKYYAGAPLIASEGAAALRVGAGLNVLAVPDFLAACMYERVSESTVFPLSSERGFISFKAEEFRALSNGVSAFCIGMGLGECPDLGGILEYLLGLEVPILLDADALNYLANNRLSIIGNIRGRGAGVIITPHIGEMSRLCRSDIGRIAKNPVSFAKDFSEKYGVITLLKGAKTVITDGRRVLINTRGGPYMAKGGSGDLLSGIIGGLIAGGRDPLLSAGAGAYIAGSAAFLASRELSEYGVLPTDSTAFIPKVIIDLF